MGNAQLSPFECDKYENNMTALLKATSLYAIGDLWRLGVHKQCNLKRDNCSGFYKSARCPLDSNQARRSPERFFARSKSSSFAVSVASSI